MSKHQEWKMIHLLYGYAHPSLNGNGYVLTDLELNAAGVHCNADTRLPLETAGIIERNGIEYQLSRTAGEMIRTFTVALGLPSGFDIRIDYPEVFVIMPFNEPWSNHVFTQIFEPAIKDAGFSVLRGDSIVRIGDLTTNVWQYITQAGVVVAEVSAPNPNVYYEIGLATALGKPIFLFKQKDIKLPADFGGAHYYEYDPNDIAQSLQLLTNELNKWAVHPDHQPFGVKNLVDRK